MWAAVFFIALGLGAFAMRVLSERPGRIRDTVRSIYLIEGYLVPYRMLVVTAPLTGVGALAMGLAVLLPRYYGAWLASAGVVTIFVAAALSFRPPRRLVPGWFRDELEAGTLPPLRIGLFDRAHLAFLILAAIVGTAAFIMLIVVYEAAGSPP